MSSITHQGKRWNDKRPHHRSTKPPRRSSNSNLLQSEQAVSIGSHQQRNKALIILSFCLFHFLTFYGHLEVKPDLIHDKTITQRLPDHLELSPKQLSASISHNLIPVNERSSPKTATILWQVPPVSSTANMLYRCMGKTVTEKIGIDPRFGHTDKNHLVLFQPYINEDWKTVNVDTTTSSGIDRAASLGLVTKYGDDLLIMTNEPYRAASKLFSERIRGRMLVLFRNPIDRIVSRFHLRNSLGKTLLESSRKHNIANTSLYEWAPTTSDDSEDENLLVKKLLGKKITENANATDLQVAKQFVRQSVIVGLDTEIEESFRRFNVAMGINEDNQRYSECMKSVFGRVNESIEESSHAQLIAQNDLEWKFMLTRNALDIALYAHIEQLFKEKKDDGIYSSQPKNVETHHDTQISSEIVKSLTISNHLSRQELTIKPMDASLSVVHSNHFEMLTSIATEAPLITTNKKINNANFSTDKTGTDTIESHLAEVSSVFANRENETAFFWHIPKAGGTAIQNLYWCIGLTLANEVGANPKFKSIPRDVLMSFQPWKRSGNLAKVINVDVTTHKGIKRARNLGFLMNKDQPHIDFISSSLFYYASMVLFSSDHKARMFSMFRHPVERAVSKFYYLAKAHWEPTYDERWANMTLDEWATKDWGESNWLVHQLVGKQLNETVGINDLNTAKKIIQTKFVVGLLNKFDESIHRFNLLLGVNENEANNKNCIYDFTSKNVINSIRLSNKNSHAEAQKGSFAWIMISRINDLDVLLYDYIEELFESQQVLFNHT